MKTLCDQMIDLLCQADPYLTLDDHLYFQDIYKRAMIMAMFYGDRNASIKAHDLVINHVMEKLKNMLNGATNL